MLNGPAPDPFDLPTSWLPNLPDPTSPMVGTCEESDHELFLGQPAQLLPSRPALEHFEAQIIQLYPRIDPALVPRFAKEQQLRYEYFRAVDLRHSCYVADKQCPSESFCFKQGDEAQIDTGHISSYSGPTIPTEYSVAHFPAGILLPPVMRLPSKFECPICFEVKLINKPSDWTNHVHDDLRPYTCTFLDCTGPHVFKQRSDWMTHEKIKHRGPGSISCRITCMSNNCNRVFTRLDNYYQHLRRVHGNETRISKISGNIQNRAWKFESETCLFCGRIGETEKTHLLHLSKHMEQIPYLSLPTNMSSAYESTQPFGRKQLEVENSSETKAILEQGLVDPSANVSGQNQMRWTRKEEVEIKNPFLFHKASLLGTETATDSGYGSIQRKPTHTNNDLDHDTNSYFESHDAVSAPENMEAVGATETDGSVYSSASSLKRKYECVHYCDCRGHLTCCLKCSGWLFGLRRNGGRGLQRFATAFERAVLKYRQ